MKIVGHRGAKDEWPENTLLGFEKALAAGVEGIEIDVHLTADGELAVIHDKTLDRTTDGKGIVCQMSMAEIHKFDAGQGQKVPTLKEVIHLVREKGAHLFIEAKAYDIATPLLKCLEKEKAFDFCTVICFQHLFVKEIKVKDSRVQTGCLLVGAPVDPAKVVQDALADMLIINLSTVNQILVDQCHKAQIPIVVWTANSLLEFEEMRSLGVDFLMTDRPGTLCL